MESRAIDTLAARVERLERECRLWRRIAASAALCGLSCLVVGAVTRAPDDLTAQRLLIRSEGGDGRGILLSAKDGPPSLTFFSEGQEPISIGLSENGSSMISFANAGKSRLALGLSSNGTPVLNFNDENLRRRVSLGIYPQVGPTISVLDEEGRVLFKAP